MQFVTCPHCHCQVPFDETTSGQVVTCPGCAGEFRAPTLQAPNFGQASAGFHVPQVGPATKVRRVGMLEGLLDSEFKHFVTPAVVRSSYVFWFIVAILMFALLVLFNVLMLSQLGDDQRILWGLPIFDLAALGFIYSMLLTIRLLLELLMVIHRIEEHLRHIRNK